jgi:hypothetical protein
MNEDGWVVCLNSASLSLTQPGRGTATGARDEENQGILAGVKGALSVLIDKKPTMYLLYPSHPLRARQPDEQFAAVVEAVRAGGSEIAVFPMENLNRT